MALKRILATTAFCVAFAVLHGVARAQTPSPSPSPAPRSCGSIEAIGTEETETKSPCTVFTGKYVLETNYINTVTSGRSNGADVEYPQALLRLGTRNPSVNLEITLPSFERISSDGTLAAGVTDVAVAAKMKLAESSNAAYGVLTKLTFPSGAPGITAGNAQFEGDFDWSYDPNERFGISGTVAFMAASEQNAGAPAQSYFNFEPSLLANFTLPDRSSYLSAEYIYTSAYSPAVGGYSHYDVAYSRDVSSRFKFELDYGLSPHIPNGTREQYVEFGLSFLDKE
ncbi:MAG: hypothetical protein JO199_00845 [Candidatus Eremiobacteraeota bacterium]|nr:hypothetical protein [Candidatus Eremiobacteraeota bacterium]